MERLSVLGRLVFLVVALLTAAMPAAVTPTAAVAQEASPVGGTPVGAAPDAVEFGGVVDRPGPITVAELQRLPTETIEVTYLSGGEEETHTFTGTRLWGVLEAVGLGAPADARNPSVGRYVVVAASDGYRIVLSGGELDPNFGDAPVLLAWEQDGAPLAAEDAPVRLVVPGDTRGGRYVYGVVGIDVLALDEPAS